MVYPGNCSMVDFSNCCCLSYCAWSMGNTSLHLFGRRII